MAMLPTEPRSSERLVTRLDLPPSQGFTSHSLLIFARSSHQFRLVRVNSVDERGRSVQTHTHSFTTNFHQDRLIPNYAIPNGYQDLRISIYSDHYEDIEEFSFPDITSLHLFQCSMIGYDFKYECDHIRFETNHSHIKGEGRAQIWQDPVTANQLNSDSTWTTSGQTSPSDFSGSRAPSITPSSIKYTSEGVQFGRAPFPALVLLCNIRGRLGYLYLQLVHGIYIKASESQKKVLVIENEKRKPFEAQLLYADLAPGQAKNQTDITSWDLSLLRLPRHPDFQQLETQKLEFITIAFDDHASRVSFAQILDERIKLRDASRNLVRREINKARAESLPSTKAGMASSPTESYRSPRILVPRPRPAQTSPAELFSTHGFISNNNSSALANQPQHELESVGPRSPSTTSELSSMNTRFNAPNQPNYELDTTSSSSRSELSSNNSRFNVIIEPRYELFTPTTASSIGSGPTNINYGLSSAAPLSHELDASLSSSPSGHLIPRLAAPQSRSQSIPEASASPQLNVSPMAEQIMPPITQMQSATCIGQMPPPAARVPTQGSPQVRGGILQSPVTTSHLAHRSSVSSTATRGSTDHRPKHRTLGSLFKSG